MSGGEAVRRKRPTRAAAVLRGHRPSTSLKGKCICGFTVPAWETIEDHQSRMVCAELFSTTPLEVRKSRITAGTPLHQGGQENLATHRAVGEAPCIACLSYLDEVMDEGRQRRRILV